MLFSIIHLVLYVLCISYIYGACIYDHLYWRNHYNFAHTIGVTWQPNLKDSDFISILESFRLFEEGSNTKFRQQRLHEFTRLDFTYDGVDCRTVYDNGVQTINLKYPECFTPALINHEVLHALGLKHEMDRSDVSAHLTQFRPANMCKLFITPYDLYSLTHYSLKTLTANLVTPTHDKNFIGNAIIPSYCDWWSLGVLYPGKKFPPSCLTDIKLEMFDRNQYCGSFPRHWTYSQHCKLPKRYGLLDFIPRPETKFLESSDKANIFKATRDKILNMPYTRLETYFKEEILEKLEIECNESNQKKSCLCKVNSINEFLQCEITEI